MFCDVGSASRTHTYYSIVSIISITNLKFKQCLIKRFRIYVIALLWVLKYVYFSIYHLLLVSINYLLFLSYFFFTFWFSLQVNYKKHSIALHNCTENESLAHISVSDFMDRNSVIWINRNLFTKNRHWQNYRKFSVDCR